MDERKNKTIEQMKLRFLEAEHAYLRWQTLVNKRDELEQSEQKLTDQVQADRVLVRQKETYDLTAAMALAEGLKASEELLNLVKIKKRELDAQLDVLEEFSEEKINELRIDLIDQILAEYPHEEKVYRNLKSAIENNKMLVHELEDSCKLCTSLAQLIRGALDVRQIVRRQGLLSYIFGSNPNIRISQYLQAAGRLAAEALPDLKNNASKPSKDESITEVYRGLVFFLEDLGIQIKKRWGFRHLDTIVAAALEKANLFLETFEQFLIKAREVQKGLETELQSWIKAH